MWRKYGRDGTSWTVSLFWRVKDCLRKVVNKLGRIDGGGACLAKNDNPSASGPSAKKIRSRALIRSSENLPEASSPDLLAPARRADARPLMSYEREILADGPFLCSACLLLDAGDPPSAETIRQRLASRFSVASAPRRLEIETAIQDAPSSPLWTQALSLQDYPYPVVFSGRRGLPHPEPILFSEQRRWWKPAEIRRLENVRSHLAVQTILPNDNAQAAFGFVLQAAALASGGSFAAAWDEEAALLRRPEELYDITASQAPPSVQELFGVAAFPFDDAGEGRVGLATRGLPRCLMPDLQLLGVPAGRIDWGAELLASLAGQWVVSPVPQPDEPFGLMGTPADLLWRRASEVPELALPAPSKHAGIVLPSSAGNARLTASDAARWTDQLLATLAAGGLSSVSPYEARILETQARERLAYLRLLWEHGADEDLEFMVKIGFEVGAPAAPQPNGSKAEASDGEESLSEGGQRPGAQTSAAQPQREHLWFLLRETQEGAFLCELVSEPIAVKGMAPGNVSWRQAHEISDWRVRRGALTVGPRKMLATRGLLRELRGE
jgi:hypothetical protein